MKPSAASERALYFQELSRRAIDQAAQLCRGARLGAADAARSSDNPCGDDLDAADLALVAAVADGSRTDLPKWREAQARELGFWRWVAFNGYDGKDPLMFPLFQEHFMVSTFYRTGWTMAEFRDAAVIELGCGPLGMIEYLPAATRLAFDPLNDRYSRLFAKFRRHPIEYLSDRRQLRADPRSFDLAICHNVLDHSDDPDALFNELFAKLAPGGRFIFQVNLSEPALPQPEEHRRLHPSPLTFEQVMGWLAAKSEDFEHFRETAANRDNEFYFLSWGRKTRDAPVSYCRPAIALPHAAVTAAAPTERPAAADPPETAEAETADAPRPLTSSFTSSWLSGTTIKGGTEPFVNLPPIGELASEEALQTQARAEFGLGQSIAGYRSRDTAPIPAPAEREGYYGPNHTGYWLSGLSDALAITREAAKLKLGSRTRYFELGCASGRVVRHLAFHTDAPISCCDLNKRHTEWVRLFLPERINVFHSSVNPHLPLEDNSVDIAAAFSVFTHIDDFEIAWLLELRRILRPGGVAYLTVATDHTWEKYKTQWIKEHLLPLADRIADYRLDERFFDGPLPREKTVFWWRGDRDVYAAMVFHHATYLRQQWGRLFEMIKIIPDGHFYQDVVLLRK